MSVCLSLSECIFDQFKVDHDLYIYIYIYVYIHICVRCEQAWPVVSWNQSSRLPERYLCHYTHPPAVFSPLNTPSNHPGSASLSISRPKSWSSSVSSAPFSSTFSSAHSHSTSTRGQEGEGSENKAVHQAPTVLLKNEKIPIWCTNTLPARENDSPNNPSNPSNLRNNREDKDVSLAVLMNRGRPAEYLQHALKRAELM